MWDKSVSTPVGLIVHGARDVNNFLADGQYFFVDILRERIVLYELDDRRLAEPKRLSQFATPVAVEVGRGGVSKDGHAFKRVFPAS